MAGTSMGPEERAVDSNLGGRAPAQAMYVPAVIS